MSDIEDSWLYGEKGNTVKEVADKQATDQESANIEDSDKIQSAKEQESAPLLPNEDTQDSSAAVASVDETDKGEEQFGETSLENAGFDGESVNLQGDEQAEKQANKDEEEEDNINVVIGDVETNSYVNTSNDNIGDEPSDNLQEEEKKNTPQNLDTVVTLVNNTTGELCSEDADKPWRKPGADISDYFNFGFNEEIWRAYCERQRRMRIYESGTGLSFLKLPGSHSNHSSSRHQNVINVIGGDVNRYQGAENMANQVMITAPVDYGGNLQTFTHDVSVPPPMIPAYGLMTSMMPPIYPPPYLPTVGGYYPEVNQCYQPLELPPDAQWFDQGNPDMTMGGYSGSMQMEEERHRSWERGRSEYGRRYGYDRERTCDRERPYDRDRGYRDRSHDRNREHRHRERSHRRRSRSRSHERRSRKRRSRSHSSVYRTRKKSRKSKSSSSSSG